MGLEVCKELVNQCLEKEDWQKMYHIIYDFHEKFIHRKKQSVKYEMNRKGIDTRESKY